MDRPVGSPAGSTRALGVVFLIRSFGFPEGMAATNRVRLMAHALMDLNVAVRVICTRVSERPGDVHNRNVRGSADGIPFVYTPGSTVRSDSFVVRRWREARGYVCALAELRRLKERAGLDCVYLADGGSEGWRLSVAALLLWLRLLGVPAVAELNEVPGTHDWPPARVLPRLSQLDGISGVVAISQWLSDWAGAEARRIGRTLRIIEIPVMVDTDEVAAHTGVVDGQLFVYSASSQYLSDLVFVLGAMRRVWRRFPDARLVVTGMQPKRALAVVEQEGLGPAVNGGGLRLAGYLDRPALLALYRNAAALLIPLRDDLRSRARFPSKVGEYLASGRPVVTSRVGEVERYLRDEETAYIAAPGDVTDFADNMAMAVQDPSRAAIIGARGRRAAEESFHYDSHGIRLRAFIEDVCMTSSGAPESEC